MTITKEQLAARISGREYCEEVTREDIEDAEASGLIIVFGASDDLTEFAARFTRKAIQDRRQATLSRPAPSFSRRRMRMTILTKKRRVVEAGARPLQTIWQRSRRNGVRRAFRVHGASLPAFLLPASTSWRTASFTAVESCSRPQPPNPRHVRARREMMSKTKNDGGPAFPLKNPSFCSKERFNGISLRDWFAGQALIGSMSHPYDFATATKRQVAVAMYEIADAMLAARSAP